MNNLKRILAGFLTLAIIIAGIIIVPTRTKATNDLTVHYTQMDISKYWNADADARKVPVENGYVFGGWYADADGTDPLTETELKNTVDIATLGQTTYAKFVPAYVLSVKTQLQKDVSDANGVDCSEAYLRLISSVDSEKYGSLGFTIHYNKKTTEALTQNVTLNKIYTYTELQSEESSGNTPKTMFGDASNYFSILRIDSIKANNFAKVIYVRPWWVTLDGTTVHGMSKYVRVQDGFKDNRYVSIPINLMVDDAKDDGVGIGQVQMTYPEGFTYIDAVNTVSNCQGLAYADFSMYHDASNCKVTFLAKSCVPTSNTFNHEFVDASADEHLFGCIWFKVDDTIEAGEYDFTFPAFSFSNWHEELNADVTLGTYSYKLEKNSDETSE